MRWLLAGLLVGLSALPGWSACRLGLTLGLDVSSSVDAAEYELQLEGLAWALEDREVQIALFQLPGAFVKLQIFEWSGVNDQSIVQDWIAATGPDVVTGIAARLRGHTRRYMSNPTALGQALIFARGELDRASDCAARKMDISGDGQSNVGIPPQTVYGRVDFADITVNGLAIQSDERALARYYRSFVIHGPGAFVETARDFDDYREAIKRKLIRELGVPRLGMR